MFEMLKERLSQGLALIAQGREIIDEVRENVADGKAALSTNDLAELNAMLDRVTAESEELSARIQRA